MRRHVLIASILSAPALLSAQTLPLGATVGGQIRVRVESYDAGGFNPANSDSYALTRILLNARVHPTASTSLFVEGMDARGPWKNKTPAGAPFRDRKSTRLNSSHVEISYAVFCLKKKKK